MPIISIHQPNFCPRASYFDKIAASDVFIILAHCNYTKGGFQNRFNVDYKFYGMAVDKGTDLIINKHYKNPARDWEKITSNFPKLKMFDGCVNDRLFKMNSAIILTVCQKLGIKTKIGFDWATALTGTARLVEICKVHKATKYLSGISGKNYLDLSLFEAAGIEVEFQDENKIDKRPLTELI